jgi:murein DD-endopeptidase MepM/ murein hydrolase activator NlpD
LNKTKKKMNKLLIAIGNPHRKFNMKKNKQSRWLPILGALVLFGCMRVPEQKKIWPWEYGTGQGEPNTGDYASFRAGVANFGEAPRAVKPIEPEPVEPRTPDARPVAETLATKTEPPIVSEQRKEKATGNKKNSYDFTVSEKRFLGAANSLQNSTSPAYDITASNYGNAPVSVAITIDKDSAEIVSADKTLPYYAVVPAHSDRALVQFSAKTKELTFNVRYNSVWSIGDYSATHNCPEQYLFPFGENVQAFASITNTADSTPYTRNAVIFSMPKGTPVLAARKGVVIQTGSDGKIDILHEDSTIGTYYHLERTDEYVVVGKKVTTDDVIGIARTSENNKDAYMQLTVWRPEPTTTDQLRASSQRIGFEAMSYPLAFKSAGSDKGKVLTKSQPVSRGKLRASNKQTKHR